MEQATVNTILVIAVGAFTGLLTYVFTDTKKTIQTELAECRRKTELLEAKFHEFENEKYNKIMEVLSGIKADIAVIKNEIDNLKGK